MDVHRDLIAPTEKSTPWNKGKLIGAKPPLWPKHVWSIRTRLQIEKRSLDLALFNLAIDSKLRGCDVVALRVEDVAPNGYAIARATVRQKKTGRPVRFELTDQTRQAVDSYLKEARRVSVHKPASARREHDYEAVRSPRFGMDCRHRVRPACAPIHSGAPRRP
jgi:integrase